MSDILLAKTLLPDGWIDTAIGEAHIVKEALFKSCNFSKSHLVNLELDKKCEYPAPNGYPPLVKLLEDRHNAPVIITNGAKQALSATFYAINAMGKTNLGMRTPYWALIPPLAKMHGLKFVQKDYDAYLAILPNNPCGFMFDYDYAKYLSDHHKELGIPFIHDAVYYSHTYLPLSYNLGPLGDLQIYSMSKMFGLSGLRVGYIVCYNKDYYKTLQEYIETTTVGVSVASQYICHNILKELAQEDKYSKFIEESRNKLYIAKALCKTIRKDVLGVPDDFMESNGIFGWFKVGERCDFTKARINTVNGKLFGDESMVRFNLGLPTNTMIEVVERLNSL